MRLNKFTPVNLKAAVLLVLALLISVTSAVAFLPDQELGDAREDRARTLTIAGEDRQCSEYPDSTGTFSYLKRFSEVEDHHLVNVYKCVDNIPECNNGWEFIREISGGDLFIGEGSQYYAYEVYQCPLEQSCGNLNYRCETIDQSQVCLNNEWVDDTFCSGESQCDPDTGTCVSPDSICTPEWSCTEWSSCNAEGLRLRSCEDRNSCGEFSDAPATKETCTPTQEEVEEDLSEEDQAKETTNPDRGEDTTGSPGSGTEEDDVNVIRENAGTIGIGFLIIIALLLWWVFKE